MRGRREKEGNLDSEVYNRDSGQSHLTRLGVPRSMRCIERTIKLIYIPDLTSAARERFMLGLLDISVHLSTNVYHLDSGQSHLQSLVVPRSIRCIECPIMLIYIPDLTPEAQDHFMM